MSLLTRVVRRLLFAIASAYLALTLAFFLVALTPDPNVGLVAFNAHDAEAAREAVRQYKAARGLDGPILQRWLDWIVSYSTLDWGRSFSSGIPVLVLLRYNLPFTLVYVVPSVVLSALGSVALAVRSATTDHPLRDRATTVLTAASLGVPNYLAALVISYLFVRHAGFVFGFYGPRNLWALDTLQHYGLPIALLTSTFLGAQYLFARSEVQEYTSTQVTKLLEAKGAGPWRVGRHLVRLAAIPLVSMVATDVLGILVVHVFVIESVLNLPGLGSMTLAAIRNRDMPVILGATMTIVLFGIAARFLQDVAFYYLDPRLRSEG